MFNLLCYLPIYLTINFFNDRYSKRGYWIDTLVCGITWNIVRFELVSQRKEKQKNSRPLP